MIIKIKSQNLINNKSKYILDKNYNIKKSNRALKYIALFFILQNILFSEILKNVNDKYIWVKMESVADTSNIDSVLSFAQKNNIDKIFFQIRGRGDALYESQLVPKFEGLDSLFDPLNYALEKTQNTEIEIHAWFNAYILWSKPTLPKDSTHFYYSCPECLATDINGKSDKDINLNQNHSNNWEGVFLSPLHKRVNSHLLLVIDELLKTYDIDGLHLDYVRFQDIFYGYNFDGINSFISKYNFNPKDLDRGIISTRFGFKEHQVDSLQNIWDNYKLDSITDLIKSTKDLIENSGIDIDLTVAVKPDIIESKYRWSQDWMLWLKSNLIDYAVVMNYETDINKFNLHNKLIKNRLNHTNLNKVIIGISTFNQNSLKASDKIILSRLNGYENFSIFNYDIEKDTTNWYVPVINTLNFNLGDVE